MSRHRIAIVLILLAPMAAGAGLFWPWRAPPTRADAADAAGDDAALPVPPAPPRVAEGEQYERCLAMLPDDPSGAAAMAEAWLPAGGGEAATHCLALARLAAGEADIAARMLQSLAAGSAAPPAQRAQVFGQAGQAWMVAADPARALAAQTDALALAPDDAGLLVDRAGAESALEHYADAARDLDAALDVDPSRDDALVARASALRHLGRLDVARDDVNRVLARDPDNAEALLERGVLRERGDDVAGARSDWERAISLRPDTDTADLAQQDLALLDAGPDRR